jgi:hypothetical protein
MVSGQVAGVLPLEDAQLLDTVNPGRGIQTRDHPDRQAQEQTPASDIMLTGVALLMFGQGFPCCYFLLFG